MYALRINIIILLLFLSQPSPAQSTNIDPERTRQLLKWSYNARIELQNGQERIIKLPVRDQELEYRKLVDRVIHQANSKDPYEQDMILTLQRVQILHNVVKDAPSSPKRDAFARRILSEGIENTVKLSMYRAIDQQFGQAIILTGWAVYMLNLTYALPNIETRIGFIESALGLLYNDILNNNIWNRKLAPVAKDIAEFEANKEAVRSNLSDILWSRKLRTHYEQRVMNLLDLLAPLGVDFQAYYLNLTSVNSVEKNIRNYEQDMKKIGAKIVGQLDLCPQNMAHGTYVIRRRQIIWRKLKKICIPLESISDAYLSNDDYQCEPGFTAGRFFWGDYDKSKPPVVVCRRISTLPRYYFAYYRRGCASGYTRKNYLAGYTTLEVISVFAPFPPQVASNYMESRNNFLCVKNHK